MTRKTMKATEKSQVMPMRSLSSGGTGEVLNSADGSTAIALCLEVALHLLVQLQCHLLVAGLEDQLTILIVLHIGNEFGDFEGPSLRFLDRACAQALLQFVPINRGTRRRIALGGCYGIGHGDAPMTTRIHPVSLHRNELWK